VNTALPAILGDPAHGSTLTAARRKLERRGQARSRCSGAAAHARLALRRCEPELAGYPQTYELVSTSYSPGSTYRVAVTATNKRRLDDGPVSAPTDAAFEPGEPGQAPLRPGASPPSVWPRAPAARSRSPCLREASRPATRVIVVAAKGSDAGADRLPSPTRGAIRTTTDLNAQAGAGSGLGVGIASAYLTTALQPGDPIDHRLAGPATYSGRWAAGYAFAGLAPRQPTSRRCPGGYGTQLGRRADDARRRRTRSSSSPRTASRRPPTRPGALHRPRLVARGSTGPEDRAVRIRDRHLGRLAGRRCEAERQQAAGRAPS